MQRIQAKSKKNTTYAKSAFKTTNKSKLAIEFSIITTCFHESGHAMAALLNFGYVHSVACQINKKKSTTYLGEMKYDGAAELENTTDPILFHRLLMGDIAVYQAGLAAEKIFYKEICGMDQLPACIKEGYQIDFGYVSDIIKEYNLAPPGKKRYAFKKKSFRQVQKLLYNNWDDVKLIAHTLFQKKKLFHDDLKLILTNKSLNKKFWKEQFKSIEILSSQSDSDFPESHIKKLFKI